MSIIRSSQIVTNGLVLALDAGDTNSYPGSGTSWFDLSGNGNHATIYNSPTWNAAGYFSLDGIDDYIKTTNTLNLSNNNKVTVIVIFQPKTYPASGNPKVLFELTNNFNNFTTSFACFYNDTYAGPPATSYDISVAIKGDVGYNLGFWSKSNFNDLAWKNTTFLYDKSQASTENLLYMQGSPATALYNPHVSLANNNTNNFANDNFYIGTRGAAIGSYNADINLASVLIYNRILSDAEISQNFNASRARFGI